MDRTENNSPSHTPPSELKTGVTNDWLTDDPLGFADSFDDTVAQDLELANQTNLVAFDGDTSRANPNFVPLLPDPINRDAPARQLIMDTETTGLDAQGGDRIIEVGIVELVGRKFTGEKLHVYINPKRGMDEEAIRIHGISEAFLADKPTFDQVAKKLYDFMFGAELIAHNAPFDMGFLSMEFAKVGLTDFADNVRVTDSLVLAKERYPGQKNTLDALVRRLNVGKMDRTFHGALLDSEILAEVYLAMTGGQVSLAIDEQRSSEDGKAHATYEHLAHTLVASTTNETAHLAWMAGLLAKHPALSQTQGVQCWHEHQPQPINFVLSHAADFEADKEVLQKTDVCIEQLQKNRHLFIGL